jgi:hypothetical protein
MWMLSGIFELRPLVFRKQPKIVDDRHVMGGVVVGTSVIQTMGSKGLQ